MYQAAMAQRMGGGAGRRFDEYYRCYPIAMLPGPDRESANHGGKVFMPASALEKLTRLHITYPMLFELINGAKEKSTHAGVLEFTAEEGKIYLPLWLMNTLLLEAGDLLQIKSTDLPPGTFIKLQPQSPSFLDISDPKAVLENAFRNFSCLTVGDIFSFDYNDEIYEIGVKEVKPSLEAQAVCTLETDLSVDFDEPVGYQEWAKAQEANKKSVPSSGAVAGGKINTQGSMAEAINYSAIAPSSDVAVKGGKAVASNFQTDGQRLGKKSSAKPSPGASTPLGVTSANIPPRLNAGNGPQPLRLPKGKLFFGYEYKPPPPKDSARRTEAAEQTKKSHFAGRGQNMRGKIVDSTSDEMKDVQQAASEVDRKGGRSLRDTPAS